MESSGLVLERPNRQAQQVSSMKNGKTNDPKPVHKCPLCCKYFPLHKLRLHFVVHTTERPYKCAYCSLDFAWKSGVRKHIERGHVGRSVERGFQLKEGSIFHNPNPWEEMGYSLDENDVRLAKNPRQNERNRPPTCNQCKKLFGSTLLLKAHMNRHPKRKTHPFHCKECGNSFTNKPLLKRHTISHSDERPFVCSICGCAFKHNNSLTRHTNGSHPNKINE